MAKEEVWEHLNRKLGYEIAAILEKSTLSQADLKGAIPYKDVHYEQINRILTGRPDLDIFEIPPTKEGRSCEARC